MIEKLLNSIENIDVMIYSGGKTGGSTLTKSFRLMPPHPKTFHIHSNDAFNGKYKIRNIIEKEKNGKKLLIVSSYREPIERHISAFFENIERFYPDKNSDEILNMDINDIFTKVIQIIREYREYYHPHLEDDCKGFDGINIFDKPFFKEKGYQVYETSKVKIIMLRFDKISNWEEIIINNTDYENFKLISANLTSEKIYYDLYKKVVSEIVIPKEIINDIFAREQKNLSYFYDDDEILSIKNRWLIM